jgi:lipopolysaccharide biosynthesis glycosyltransferase
MPKNKRVRKWVNVCEFLLSMKNPQNYINAGMLLLNCKKFRETYTIEYVINTIVSRNWKVHDQDVINALAEDKILYFHKHYNYMPSIYAKYLPEKYLSEHLDAQKNPKIIHYKPYAVWYYIKHFDEFWKYATRTPFAKEIVAITNKNDIINKELDEKVCITIRQRTGFGGIAILKAILAFFTRKFR